MASILSQPNGRKRIDFVGLDRRKHSLRLGKTSDKIAGQLRNRVEAILECAAFGKPFDPELATWLTKLAPEMKAKFVGAGLLTLEESGQHPESTLGAFVSAYLARRNDVKTGTKVFMGHTVRNLGDFFGDDRELGDITPGECEDFKRWLLTDQKLSNSTACRRCSLAATIFKDAKKRRLIAENPWLDVKRSARTNPERQQYIPWEAIQQAIDKAPNADWRLLIAGARIAGWRTPSEPLSLRWEDIDWERSRMTITSPKTEHHQGKGYRSCPLFPELRPYLEAMFELADEGDAFVFQKMRAARGLPTKPDSKVDWNGVNLGTTFGKILKRAGLTPWPKLWHNLRASAETDLANRFPLHVVCEWIGNSLAIARDHYLQVTDDHFRQAVSNPQENPQEYSSRLETVSAKPTKKPLENKGLSLEPLGGTGLETPSFSKRKTSFRDQPAAESAGVHLFGGDAADGPDTELARLLRVWPTLSTVDREALAAHAETLASGRTTSRTSRSTRSPQRPPIAAVDDVTPVTNSAR